MGYVDDITKLAAEFDALIDDLVYKEAAKKKKYWIQEAVKRPGRWKGKSLGWMKKRYSTLKKKEDKTKSEISEMRSLALGIRMKGGDVPGGKKKKGLKGKKASD